MKKWDIQATKIAVVTKSAMVKDKGKRGFSMLEMQAWVPAGAMGLGLTPHLEHEKRYALTHLASGFLLSDHPWKKGPLVAQLIHDLESLPVSWMASREEIEKTPPEIREKIGDLIYEAIKKDGH